LLSGGQGLLDEEDLLPLGRSLVDAFKRLAR
jgi:hypothetical protein